MYHHRYWFLLLLELLPMLESAELFFESDHIYELMNCVAELRQTRLHNLVSHKSVWLLFIARSADRICW